MMYMITPKRFGECVHEIHEMHRLRYRVFKERLNWDVEVSGDLEIDRFDALSPTYLVHKGQDGRILGVRPAPTHDRPDDARRDLPRAARWKPVAARPPNLGE